MIPAILDMISDDEGAITIDWTLVGAAAVGMALAAISLIGGSAQHSTIQTSSAISNYEINGAFQGQPEEVVALFVSIEREPVNN